MKKITIVLLIASVLAPAAGTSAADTRVGGSLYAHWMMDLSDDAESFNEFELTRAYIDIRSKLSDYTSVRLTTDLRSSEVDGSEVYNIILKYAHIDWKPAFANGVMTFRLGLQPTPYIDMMNKLWNRRYIVRTIGDDRKFLTSADAGAGLIFDLGKEGKSGHFTANVWNGTSYSDIEEMNKQKDFSAFIYLTPLADNPDLERSAFQAQAYIGTQNEEIGTLLLDDGVTEVELEGTDYERTLFSFGGLLAYRNTFDVGVDVNFLKEGQGRSEVDGTALDDVSQRGLSFFSTLYLGDLVAADSPLRTINLFARVDMHDPDTDIDDNGSTLIIGGVECAPVKGFKASVNVRSESYQAENVDSDTYLFFNTLFKF